MATGRAADGVHMELRSGRAMGPTANPHRRESAEDAVQVSIKALRRLGPRPGKPSRQAPPAKNPDQGEGGLAGGRIEETGDMCETQTAGTSW